MMTIVEKYLDEISTNKPNFQDYHFNILEKYKETFVGTPNQWDEFRRELYKKNAQYFETNIMAEYNAKVKHLKEEMRWELFQVSKFVSYKRGYDMFKVAWEYAEYEGQCDYPIDEQDTKECYEDVVEKYTSIEDDFIKVIEFAKEGHKYTDLRTLADDTRFEVQNGCWTGYVFSKDGVKYMHIDKTGQEVELNGKEDLIIKIIN